MGQFRYKMSVVTWMGLAMATLAPFLGVYAGAYWKMIRVECYSINPDEYGPFYSYSNDDAPAEHQEYWAAFFTPAYLVDRTIRRDAWSDPPVCFSNFECPDSPEIVVEARVPSQIDTSDFLQNSSKEPESDGVDEG